MTDTAKEHFLHKTIAASAFVFALCILPVSQYVLVSRQTSDTQGTVAGVSTDKTITQASIVSPQECEATRVKDLADLDKYLTGTKVGFDREYQKKVAPYTEAIAALKGTPEEIAAQTSELNALIEVDHAPYIKKLSDLDDAVSSQKNEIESRSCPAE